ncbi:hypothetical protein HGRIS_001719 [Hohenbuehelia grisea]|uniref:Major facilitator superfamily (MFS) profile domain-containing protein n=1 Tax=Hohenbuehelia grisea TaxID=104357 RepID=A0ABR3JIN1_9AGAR
MEGRKCSWSGRYRLLCFLWLADLREVPEFQFPEFTSTDSLLAKEALYVLRAFQGVGTAAAIPAAVSLVTLNMSCQYECNFQMGILAQSFPPSKARAVAFATFSAGNPLGAGLGMVMGGLLTEVSAATWRANFYLFSGITCICLIGGAYSIDSDRVSAEKDKRIDWIGSLLITSSLILIIFVLAQGELAPQQWATPYIFVLLILGVILLVLFLLWQTYLERILNDFSAPRSRWTPPPIMKPSLWLQAKGRIAAIMWIAFLTWCVFRSWSYWVQLYYQEYLRLSPIQTMLRLLPVFIVGVLCNVFMAQVSGRIPVVWVVVVGALVTSTSSLLFALIDPRASYWAFGFPAAVFSVWGADFVFTSGTLLIAKTISQTEQSLAGGVFQTMTQIGTAITVPVTTIVYNSVVQREEAKVAGITITDTMRREMDLNGYRAAQWCAFGFGILAAILGLISLRGVGVVGHRGNPPAKDKQVDIEKQSVTSTLTHISDVDVLSDCSSDIDSIISVPTHEEVEAQVSRLERKEKRLSGLDSRPGSRDVPSVRDTSNLHQLWMLAKQGKRRPESEYEGSSSSSSGSATPRSL